MLHVKDGNTDVDAIRSAIAEAKKETSKPTLIKVSTLIGYGSPNKADTHDAHGAPLGAEEAQLTRENLKWPYGEFEARPAAAWARKSPRRAAAWTGGVRMGCARSCAVLQSQFPLSVPLAGRLAGPRKHSAARGLASTRLWMAMPEQSPDLPCETSIAGALPIGQSSSRQRRLLLNCHIGARAERHVGRGR